MNIVLAIIIKKILSSLIKKLWNPILINPQCGLIKPFRNFDYVYLLMIEFLKKTIIRNKNKDSIDGLFNF